MDQDRDTTSAQADGGPRSTLEGLAPWTRPRVGLTLVVINLLVFAAWEAGGLPRSLASHLALSAEAVREGHLWTLVSAAFLHVDPLHLLGTSALLYLCARHLEGERGGGVVAAAWIGGGLACALGWIASPWSVDLPPELHLASGDPGASTASGAALSVATLTLASAPGRSTNLLGIDLPLVAFVAAYALCDLVGLPRLEPASDLGPGAHLHHLAGVPVGLLLFRLGAPRQADAAGGPPAAPAVVPSVRTPEPDEPAIDAATTERVDDLLRKIHREGLTSLEPEERAFLDKASARYRRISE